MDRQRWRSHDTFLSEHFSRGGKNMKSSPEVAFKAKVHGSKGMAKEKLGKVMNDPTLEGKDENKVGRIQRKVFQADTSIKK